MMVGWLVLILALAPLLAVLGCVATRRPRVSEKLNLFASVISFAAALPLPFLTGARAVFFLNGYVIVDRMGAWVVLCTAIVYALSSIYAVGYMRLLGEDARLADFYALFAGFALTTLVAPLMNNVGIYWIAIELTTLVSTFLVAFERAAESMEATWKYIMAVSAGITLALLGTVLFYWGGTFVFGPTYQMTWAALARAAPKIDPVLMNLAFLLVLVGYGTKVGLAPMHNWLPDAHSESPAPVSAMLSGALLNTAIIGIARFLGVMHSAQLGALSAFALVVLGVLSLLIGALFIVRQRGIKRLMAYSSVEHMGVIALGLGFGGPLGIAGALYHMLNHSLNKALMFFGAGVMMRAYGTKEIEKIRGVFTHFPRSGALWLAGAVAITGAPPFGLFMSEFAIMRAGMTPRFSWAVYVMAVLLIVIFIGFLNHFRAMYYDNAEDGGKTGYPAKTEGVWCIVPMGLALVPLLVFGLWWPPDLWLYLASIAHSLSPVTP
ncbi:proton-conducting transporter transmembrane domain-containing protein [Varunaivibrio sulfuroxidans]|uniref:Hydrogenase-4 component F n=1 Tax=Varunaivibrio sulfuroxidans TaxID=1773489 RepID=A0A4R3JB14_9PROT|nr:proton-conducting transporter membrane subunit [Varunaivibrio sulfuroxidans]TCS63078.1 hydrogenase-4 component F [Varunaivibrio sulfuroxidans]WES31850.1 proton-conducting transporter membrane subunit [Varunaivibrio sulfuroxidans]